MHHAALLTVSVVAAGAGSSVVTTFVAGPLME